MSLVERKRNRARQRLLGAARELIAKGGVEGLRLRAIVDRAEIGFGSFYTHFGSKEELVEAVVLDTVESLTQSIIERASAFEDPAEQTAFAQSRFIRIAFEDPDLARLIVHLDQADALLESASIPRLGPVLIRGLSSGRFEAVDHHVAISFAVGGTLATCRGILSGRLGEGADLEAARLLLRAFGLAPSEADEVVRRVEEEPAEPQMVAGGASR